MRLRRRDDRVPAGIGTVDFEPREPQYDRLVERPGVRRLAREQRLPLLEQIDASLEIARVIACARQLQSRAAARLAQLFGRRELTLRFLLVGGERRQCFLLRDALLLEIRARRRQRQSVRDDGEILRGVGEREGLDERSLRTVRRAREIVRVIKLFCQLAVRKYGHTGASVARFLGVTTSLVNRYAASGDSFELGKG